METNPIAVWGECVARLNDEQLATLSSERGYSGDFSLWLRSCGLIGLYDGGVALPIHSATGEIVGIHYRKPDRSWRVWPDCKMRPLIVGDVTRAKMVFAFESQWDAFAFLDVVGLWRNIASSAVVATRGAANGNLIKSLCQPGTSVLAFPQRDTPDAKGRVASEFWLKQIVANAGCPVFRVMVPPQFKDFNEWTISGAIASDIQKVLESMESCKLPSAESQMLNDSRRKVELPGDNRLLSDFAEELAKELDSKNIFSHAGQVVRVNADGCCIEIISGSQFRTLIEEYVICYRRHASGQGTVSLNRTLAKQDADGVMAAHRFHKWLRPLTRLNPVRLPVLRKSGIIELLPEGYDAETCIYTLGDKFEYVEQLTVGEAKKVLDELLCEFRFEDAQRSKAVAVSAMFTLFALGLLPPGCLRPCFIYLANAEGAGKTLLVKCAVVPVFGTFPASAIPSDEAEIRKTLLCAVREGRLVLVFDNVKDRLSSGALEAFITSATWTDRVLGVSASFTGPNYCTVFITGNQCSVSPDMRRRSLFVCLFQPVDRPEARQFKKPLEVPQLLELRGKIRSALWALVKHWDKANRPACSSTSPSFQDWSNMIGGIVEHAGYSCPVAMQDTALSADAELKDMTKLVSALSLSLGPSGQGVDFGKIVEISMGLGLFETITGGGKEQVLDRSARAALSKLLARYDQRTFQNGYKFIIQGAGHTRKYGVQKVNVPP